jgi:hypothetical protein
LKNKQQIKSSIYENSLFAVFIRYTSCYSDSRFSDGQNSPFDTSAWFDPSTWFDKLTNRSGHRKLTNRSQCRQAHQPLSAGKLRDRLAPLR